jgi:hypothetical protein
VRASGHPSRLDREVRELLRDDPELLALAELIAALQPEEVECAPRRGRWRRSRVPRAVRTLFLKARRRPSRSSTPG